MSVTSAAFWVGRVVAWRRLVALWVSAVICAITLATLSAGAQAPAPARGVGEATSWIGV